MSEDKLKEIIKEYFPHVGNITLQQVAEEILKHYIPISEDKGLEEIKEQYEASLNDRTPMPPWEQIEAMISANYLPISEVVRVIKEEDVDTRIEDALVLGDRSIKRFEQYKTNKEIEG